MAEWQNITKSFSEDRWVPDPGSPNSAPLWEPLSGVLAPGSRGPSPENLLPFLSCTTLDSCSALCRLLIAGTDSSDLQQILSLLESAEDLLLTSSYLSTSSFTGKHTNFLVTQYLDAFGSRWCSWSVSTTVVGEGAGGLLEERSVGRWRQRRALGSPVLPFLQLSQSGLLTSFVPPQLLRLYQLLLFTLPGTPVFSYGDEIGLEEAGLPGQVSLAACPAQWGRLHSSVTVVLWLAVHGKRLGEEPALDC